MVYKLKLPESGKVVRFRGLNIDDELQVYRLIGPGADSEPSMVRGMMILLETVRLAIVSVDGVPATYEQFVGLKLSEAFPSRDIKFLTSAYAKKCGEPGQEEMEAFFSKELTTEP